MLAGMPFARGVCRCAHSSRSGPWAFGERPLHIKENLVNFALRLKEGQELGARAFLRHSVLMLPTLRP